MFVNPVMHLDEREQRLCERDFDEVARRLREPLLMMHFRPHFVARPYGTLDLFKKFNARIAR